MKLQLREIWLSRSPRDRVIVAALAITLALALYLWLLLSSHHARAKLHASISNLQTQAARVDEQAAELVRLRTAPSLVASQTDVLTLIRNQAAASGLARGLARTEALDVSRATAVFNAIPFQDWLSLVANLQSQRVRLEACRIEGQVQPGTVNVTATFTQAR